MLVQRYNTPYIFFSFSLVVGVSYFDVEYKGKLATSSIAAHPKMYCSIWCKANGCYVNTEQCLMIEQTGKKNTYTSVDSFLTLQTTFSLSSLSPFPSLCLFLNFSLSLASLYASAR